MHSVVHISKKITSKISFATKRKLTQDLNLIINHSFFFNFFYFPGHKFYITSNGLKLSSFLSNVIVLMLIHRHLNMLNFK